MASQTYTTNTQPEQTSGWAIGAITFAAFMMIMAGAFQGLLGFIAVLQDEFFVATPSYVFQFDATTWGWIHMLLGLVVFGAGIGVLAGQTWARAVGILLALLSAVANFVFMPYYPVWSLLIIALDVLVIWALVAHGGAFRRDAY